MKTILILLAVYVGIGLLVSVTLAFRKSKSPHAVKAIELMGVDLYSSSLGVAFLLWPLWVFMQIVEQDTLGPLKETETKEKEESLDTLLGRIGKSVTPLVPCGRIEIDKKDYEALSDEGKIDRDEEVEVFALSMGTLKVRRFQPGASHNGGKPPRES